MTSERDAEILAQHPYTDDELAFMNAESWGPAEDWSDWLKTLDHSSFGRSPTPSQ